MENILLLQSQHFYLYWSRSSVATSQQEKMASQSITRSSIEIIEDSTLSRPLSSNNVWSSTDLLTCSDDNTSNLSQDEFLSVASCSSPISDQQSFVILND